MSKHDKRAARFGERGCIVHLSHCTILSSYGGLFIHSRRWRTVAEFRRAANRHGGKVTQKRTRRGLVVLGYGLTFDKEPSSEPQRAAFWQDGAWVGPPGSRFKIYPDQPGYRPRRALTPDPSEAR